MRTFAQVF